MATAFTTVYNTALSKIREYAFLDATDEEIGDMLYPFLKSAETDFSRICVESLEHDAADDEYPTEYTSDLSKESIEILALGVCTYWLSAYVADSDKLRNAIGTKDYTLFSPANLLSTIHTVRNDIDLDYHAKINLYSFLNSNIIRDEAPHKRGHRR